MKIDMDSLIYLLQVSQKELIDAKSRYYKQDCRCKAIIYGEGTISSSILRDIVTKYDVVGIVSPSNPEVVRDLDFDKYIVINEETSEKVNKLFAYHVSETRCIIDYVCKDTMIDVKKIMAAQRGASTETNRLDVIVNYLAIDDFLNGREKYINLYKSMKMKRLRCTYEKADQLWIKFTELIENIKDSGYDSTKPILVDNKYHIFDGSHRLAVALFFGIEKIPVKISPKEFRNIYDINWFWMNGFSDLELQDLRLDANKVFEKHKINMTYRSL